MFTAMPSVNPGTPAEILATATPLNPSLAAVLESNPIPAGSFYTIPDLKALSTYGLSHLQARLTASRPANISESNHEISLPSGHKSRLLVCKLASQPPGTKSPLIVLFHGGGHTVGCPENELLLARELAQKYSAVVVMPSYALAPEHPFPGSITTSWEALQYIASETISPHDNSNSIFPPSSSSNLDPNLGFIVGGTSAGSGLCSALSHLARDNNLFPPLTGQMLSCGTYISPLHIPPKYRHLYLSRTQPECRTSPILDEDLLALFHQAFKPDHTSPLWASFDQHHPDDQRGEEVKMGHRGLPPTYLQVCGLDLSRDDGLIFERVLREECDVKTRLDLYAGLPHVWWSMFPGLEVSERRMRDAVEGVGWLLDVGGK
jgi:acetyl esterase/lipase